MAEPAAIWADALRVTALLAADPQACGGVVVRAGAGPVRDRWLDAFRKTLPPGTPWRRLPPGIGDDRLLGGLDLAATLRTGRPVAQGGLLAEADGGIVLVPMAERLPAGTVAKLCAALDTGTVGLERDGLTGRQPARFALVLLDEGAEDETVAEALADRLAFRVDLSGVGFRETGEDSFSRQRPHPEVPERSGGLEGGLQEALRSLEPSFEAADAAPQDEGAGGRGGTARRGAALAGRVDSASLRTETSPRGPDAAEAGGDAPIDSIAILCAAAEDLGIVSLRGPLLAARVARLAAAFAGRAAPAETDVIEAARLVLAPRATRLPPGAPPQEAPDEAPEDAPCEPPSDAPPPEAGPPQEPGEDDGERAETDPREMVLEAARAAIPANLLAQLLAGGPRLRSAKAGRMGASAAAPRSGRPAGSRPGDPRRGRLDLIATLRAAAPWQRLRRGPGETRRVVVLPDDLRIKRLVQRSETTVIVCVDASGSAAMERLAEAKGAVELLLAQSYVRRDRVALVAFRGIAAEAVLPPTRSLVRAKRALAGLPGGGGTPLAAGLDAATLMALGVRRGGGDPVLVILTDGRANVARSGEGGRAKAGEEALSAGRQLKALGLKALVIDTGARPEGARRLADVAGARYIPLPHADAGSVSAAVRAATG